MVHDARELGADGVVGADLVLTPYPGGARTLECSVAGVALGVAVEIEHDDAGTRAVTGWRGVAASNAEVPAVTRLVQRTRAEARRTLDSEVDRLGADGAVVSSMALAVTETECHVYERLHDHVAEAVTVATAIAAFDRSTPSKPPPRSRRRRAPRPHEPLPVIPMASWPRSTPAERPAPLQPEWLE